MWFRYDGEMESFTAVESTVLPLLGIAVLLLPVLLLLLVVLVFIVAIMTGY